MDDDFESGHHQGDAPSLWYAHAMEQLIEVVQQLSLARDLATVMDIVRRAARRLTGADGATFVLRDNGNCFYAEEDAISPLWKGERFPMSACISGWAMLNRQAAVIEDIYADPRIPADAYRPTFVRSLAMVPIRTLDPVGAIGTYWAVRHLPTREKVRVLQALADTTAVAMENVRVYEELEQRVQWRTSELQSILHNVQVGIVFAVNGRIARGNPKSAEIFGFDSQEAMASEPLDALFRTVEDGPSLMVEACRQLTEVGMFTSEFRMPNRDGREFWCHLIAKSFGANGGSGSEIWVISDISDAKARERTLQELMVAAEQANRAKDSYLAFMSHEIRTPLAGMLGMLEQLTLTSLDQEQEETLNAAWDSGKRLLRIVNDILDWSKIEEGKLELAPHSASVRTMLQEVVDTYSSVASSKNLLLRQHADERLHPAYTFDSLRLSQVMNNFVGNALKFTRHGEIELRADLVDRFERDDRIRFSVRDTGVGIAPDVQERLFQRYQQADPETARIYGGTGLGLAICRRLADMMDGEIGLRSAPGQGSTFSISLSLPKVEALPEFVPQVSRVSVGKRNVRPLFPADEQAPLVLAVDDNPINRKLLANQLKQLGLSVETAEDSRAALELWRSGRFPTVITDCHMPDLDGYDLARQIRRIESMQSNRRTLIIGWTASALAEEAEHCRASGMDDVLVKPTDLMQLRETLFRWLGGPSAE